MKTFPAESHLSSRRKLGGRLAGGLLLVALLWSPSLLAQQPADRSVEKTARVTERGAHHAKWETVREVVDPESGETVTVTNSYVQLETGLHYPNEKGEWLESSDKIEIIPGYAVARAGLHQARWAANINTYGAIELWTPEGEYAQSHVLGLALHDPVTGESVMLGAIKDSTGVVSGNQVTYEDAFEGVLASLRYTYTKAGFVQDVILREQLPDVAELGFDPKTVQLQVLTEFVTLPPQSSEVFDLTAQPAETNDVRQTAGAERYHQDAAVRIGSMTLTSGRAFGIPETGTDESVPVRKLLERFEGDRTILTETIDFERVQSELQTLPAASKPTALRWRSSPDQQARLRAAPDAPVREVARIDQTPTNGLLMARLDTPPKERDGFLIDYETINTSYSDYTFRSDTTYHVTGNVTMNGRTTIEGGTVIKFNAGYDLKFLGVVNCLTEPFRPAILTAKDDNTVGETISGSTGSPSGYYAKSAVWIDNFGSSLKHLHIRRAERAVFYNSTAVSAQQLSHVQIVNCGYGVVSLTPRFKVRNALMHNVVTNFHTTGTGITGEIEHLTSNGTSVFRGSTSLTLNVTNSLLVGVTSGYSGAGNANPTTSSGLFQTVGSGQHYLAGGSAHRNAGVTNITPALRDDFRLMTTHTPGMVYSNITFTADTVWSPIVPRDTDIPDRGYHYTAVDYAVLSVAVEGAKLILTNGVSVAGYGGGVFFWPKEGGQLLSTGTADRMNHIGEYVGVQEQPALWGATIFVGSTTPIQSKYTSSPGIVDLRYTRLPLIHSGRLSYGFSGFGQFYGYISLSLAHCEIYRGKLQESTTGVPTTLSNNLFHRPFIHTGSGIFAVQTWYNNSFIQGGITNQSTGATSWTIRDNLFDQTAFSFTGGANPVHNNNGYSSGTSVITGTTSGNVTLAGTPGFTTGPLGTFYLPANSTLVNAGSRTAASAGLYHHTTMLTGTKEAGTTVDIGYHYVGADLAVYDPVGYWRIDENTGTAVGDSTLPANNGSFVDIPTWVAGPQGYGLNFDGSNDYITVPDAAELRLNALTVVCWYKKNSESDNWTRLVGKGDSTYRNYGIWEEYSTNKRLLFQLKATDATWANVYSTTLTQSGQWYHVVGTFDGATSRLYVNGVQEGSTAFAKTLESNTLPVLFGYCSTYPYMPGALDEVRIYNRALDPGEVQRLFTQGALQEEFGFALKDTDGDTLADYLEDLNGDGVATPNSTGETDWDSVYDSPNGIATNPGLQVFTPLN